MDTPVMQKQDIAQLRVNGPRLWDALMELAQPAEMTGQSLLR